MSTLDHHPHRVLPVSNNTAHLIAADNSRLRDWLFRGGIAGPVAAFLFVLALIVISKTPYNVLVIPTLPFYLVLGLILGLVQSVMLWTGTQVFRRHLGFFSRALISLLFFIFPILLWWWANDSSTYGDNYYHYADRSTNEVASLHGIKEVKLVVNGDYDYPNQDTISVAQRRNLIIFSLNDAGIEVVENERVNLAVLCVTSSFIKDANEKDFYNSNIRVSLRQNVFLSRNPSIKTEATTWESAGSSVVAGMTEEERIKWVLSNFVADYQKANSDTGEVRTYQDQTRSKTRWTFISFGIAIVLIGLITGSRLRPWRALAYGIPREPTNSSKLKILTGVVLRSTMAFLLMESIFALVCTIQSDVEPLEFRRWYAFALVAVAHCLLSFLVSFGQLKYAAVFSLALQANGIVLLLYWFDPATNWSNFFIGEYSILWFLYVLTRFTFIRQTLSFIKQELKYYLID